MWTKELTKKLEELGYDWDDYDYQNNTYIDIYDPYNEDDPDETIATVCVNKSHILDTNTYQFNNLYEECKKELHELLTEYSSTPEDEREDPKQKYTYKHRSLKTRRGRDAYLAISVLPNLKHYSDLVDEVRNTDAFLAISVLSNKKYYPDLVDEAKDTKKYQALFTNAEMEEYNKELGIDLDNYIKEEAPTKESNDYTEGRQVNL